MVSDLAAKAGPGKGDPDPLNGPGSGLVPMDQTSVLAQKAIGPNPVAATDTIDAPSADAAGGKKPVDWGGVIKDFGKNIQTMNHGGFNNIFQGVPPPSNASPGLGVSKPQISVAGPQMPQVGLAPPMAPIAPPPPIASDRRLKVHINHEVQSIRNFLNDLYRS